MNAQQKKVRIYMKKKRILSILLAICLIMSLVPAVSVFAEANDIYIGDYNMATSGTVNLGGGTAVFNASATPPDTDAYQYQLQLYGHSELDYLQ